MMRKASMATSLKGVNYLRTLVEKQNCIFQKIDLENDLGNDAYVEFIENERATGCCIAVQVKSGDSYVTNDKSTFLLKADREHFEYWASHILPVCGVVFEPSTETAAWCDVSDFLKKNPGIISSGPYQIPIPRTHVLNENTYGDFQKHFLGYRHLYQDAAHFGEALERFAGSKNFLESNDAFRSLFSYHRNRSATWFYVLGCLKFFANHPLLMPLIFRLSHIPGHGDIFWHKGNIIDEPVRLSVLELMKQALGKDEFVVLLGAIDRENGITRGSIGQCVHSIIDTSPRRRDLLLSIAFDKSVQELIRFWAMHFLIFEMQRNPEEDVIALINSYLGDFPDSDYSDELKLTVQIIQEQGWVGFY